MANIKNFIYCLNVNSVDGRTDVVGILNTLTPEYIPGLFSFSVCFSLLDITEGEHLLDLKFKDSDKNIIAGIDNAIITYKKDSNSNMPDEYMGVNVAAGLQNVDLKKSGLYSTEVVLDGKTVGEYYIFAKGKNE